MIKHHCRAKMAVELQTECKITRVQSVQLYATSQYHYQLVVSFQPQGKILRVCRNFGELNA